MRLAPLSLAMALGLHAVVLASPRPSVRLLAGATSGLGLSAQESVPAELPSGAPAGRPARAPRPFEPVPGVREPSGVLCARPVQEGAIPAGARVGPSRAAQLRALAVQQLQSLELKRHVPATDEFLVRVPAGTPEQEVALSLMASGAFEYVEPDWIVYPVGAEVSGSTDPLVRSQWHHDATRVDTDGAWAVTTGRSTVVVAICDTGLRVTHEDFAPNRREGFHVPSRTWQLDGGPIDDINGHGTLCTGVVAADGDNGVGAAGMGWNLGYRPVRVSDFPGGEAFLSDLTLGARTAAESGDRVASVSYSGVTSFSVSTTGSYLKTLGALLVWAGGNESWTLDGDPSDDVLIVGATSSADKLTEFSNRGTLIDLVAPGASVLTTSFEADDAYAYAFGTSFSCPMVAGVCALIWSRNPDLTPDEVEQVLLSSCDDLGEPGTDPIFGRGRVNAARALERTPSHLLRFVYVNGRSPAVLPQGGTTIDVVAIPGAQQVPDPGIARLYVDAGAGFVWTPAEFLGSSTFRGTFPAATCGSTLRYYFEFFLESPSQGAGLPGSGVLRSPFRGAEAPFHVTVDASTDLLTLDEAETVGAWTLGAPGDDAVTGGWRWGRPVGSSAAPSSDRSENGEYCFVTGPNRPNASVGADDIDGGRTTLISPPFDLGFAADPALSYWRWYTNASNGSIDDVFQVDVSADDGQTWVRVEELGPEPVAGGWQRHAFRVADYVEGAASVRLRFIASDLGVGSIVEAAIDDIGAVELCPDTCGMERYCPPLPNSTGRAASVSRSGSQSVTRGDLRLHALGAPRFSFGLFLYSPDPTSTPASAGVLCVGSQTLGTVIRLKAVQTDTLGGATIAVDLADPPVPAAQILPASTWYFQFCYRDFGSGGSAGPVLNFSDALSLTFCP